MKKLLLTAAMIAPVGPALAQDTVKAVAPTSLTWMANPAIPKGGQVAILLGDPAKAGDTIVQRVLLPPNNHTSPHTHPVRRDHNSDQRRIGIRDG